MESHRVSFRGSLEDEKTEPYLFFCFRSSGVGPWGVISHDGSIGLVYLPTNLHEFTIKINYINLYDI